MFVSLYKLIWLRLAHSPTFPSFHLRHSSFSKLSVVSSTSQLIFQPFRHFTYVAAHSPTLLSILLRHRLFIYVTWRATHELSIKIKSVALQLRRAKTDWSGCCQMAVQGALWLAKRLTLNLNFSFLNQISLLLNQVATQLRRWHGKGSKSWKSKFYRGNKKQFWHY